MEPIWLTILTSGVTASVLGFIQFLIARRDSKKQVYDEKIEQISACLIGIGHDRIVHLGQEYIERGSLTRVEYENLHDYLYVPYRNLGGNGVAEKIMNEVDKLPIRERKVHE